MFSLRAPYALYTVLLNVVLLIIFTIVHLSGGSKGVVLGFALLYAGHSLIVWIMFVIVLFRSERDPFIVKHVNLWRLAFLFVVTIFQYGILYSAMLNYEPDSLFGVPPDSSRGRIFRRGLFLATETMGGLGSGAIFAKEDSEVPFVLIGLNSTQSLLLSYFVVAQVLRLFNIQASKAEQDDIRRDPIKFLRKRANLRTSDIRHQLDLYDKKKRRAYS